MLANHPADTLGALLVALITAKTHGHDFYLVMIDRFGHTPTVAQVWRSLLFEECRLLERLRSIQSLISSTMMGQPVGAASLACARSIPPILSDDRIRSIRTLEEAYRLACEYEATGLQDVTLKVTGPFYPHLDGGRILAPPPLGTQHRIASMAERFGNPIMFHLVLAERDFLQSSMSVEDADVESLSLIHPERDGWG